MKISLIVPVFNGLQYYKTFSNTIVEIYSDNRFEIIVVDDGSNDSFSILLKEQFPLIDIYYQCNQGSGIARNLGIDKATGDWVMFLDVDDEINISELNIALSLLNKHVDIFCFQAKRIMHSTKRVVEKKWKPTIFKTPFLGCCFEYPDILVDSIVMNKIFKRSYVIDSGVRFPNGKYEDKVFLTNLFLKKPRISISDVSYYRWNVYPSSGSQTNTKDMDDIKQRFHACSNQLFLTKNTPFFDIIQSNVFNHDIALYSKTYSRQRMEFQIELYQWVTYFKGVGEPKNLSDKARLIYFAEDFIEFNLAMNKEGSVLNKIKRIFKARFLGGWV